ncbi:MAG: O-antigen ligase family protein, partial [Clostridia bacterium]|nr:O-antigen ligase family protein [Clostridia bacterium]
MCYTEMNGIHLKGGSRMQSWLKSVCVLARERWSWVYACAVLMFLLPEFCAPVAAVAALLIAWRDLKAASGRWLAGYAVRWIWLYIGFMAVSILYSRTPFASLYTWLMWLVAFAFYLSLTAVTTSAERLRRLLQLLTLTAGVLGGIACVQYFGACVLGWPRELYQLWNPLNEKVYSLLPFSVRLFNEGIRVGSTFDNPNVFAETMLCLLPFALYGTITSRRWQTKCIYLACLLAGIVGMAFSFSRASYLCLLAMGCVFLIFNASHLKRARWWLLSIAVLLILLVTIPNVFTERLATIKLSERSVAERVQVWLTALPEIAAHPLCGIGAGVQGTTELMAAAGLPGVPHAHNLYLQLLLEGGALALTSFMIVIARMLSRHSVAADIKARRGFYFSVAFIASLCGFLLYGWMDYPLLSPKLVSLFW